jgi:uncharacterized protein YeaO (DUF488 family)
VSIRIVQLGSPRQPGEGPRLGTVRRPPRGVRKQDFGRLNFYDIWLPELAPSAGLLSFAHHGLETGKRWATFSRKYRRQMREATPGHLLGLLALLSKQMDFSVGCYCADESRCHRSLLRELLTEKGALTT